MTRHTAIVATTIFDQDFAGGYLDNMRRHGHDTSSTVIIIPDRKTPTTVFTRADESRRAGFDVRCPSLDEQSAYLKKLGLPADFVPWNTDNRRNVGFLMALEMNCDVLISIDDDNFCRPDSDFVGEHHIVGQTSVDSMATSDGWFNNCTLLTMTPPGEICPRGFPYYARHRERAIRANLPAERRIAVNAGLWLRDPDVDAMTRLQLAPEATGFTGKSVVLGDGTWCPVNTQNTALIREAAAIYYYVRMGFPLQGLRIDRYGDILSGYFLQKCVQHLGDAIRMGTPIADHVRTLHNLFKDLYHEQAGMVIIEELLPWLIELKLEGQSYLDAYECLADSLAASAGNFRGFVWDDGGTAFLKETAAMMRVWAGAVRHLTSTP